jgi:hypothetical protein
MDGETPRVRPRSASLAPRRRLVRRTVPRPPRIEYRVDPETARLPEWAMRTRAEVRARLANPPRKIRRWVKRMGARYEPGYGWYVERNGGVSPDDPVSPLPSSRQMDLSLQLSWPWLYDSEGRLAEVPGLTRIPVEPPVDWPVSRDVETVLAMQKLARWAERWEGFPNELREPIEDTVVTIVVGGFGEIVRVL